MRLFPAPFLLPVGLLLTCRPADVPQNPKCFPATRLQLSREKINALERFLAIDTNDSLNATRSIYYRNYCYQLLVPEGRHNGLLKVTSYNQSHWGARYIINTENQLFFIYYRAVATVGTHSIEEALAAENCRLLPGTKAAITDYVRRQKQ